MQNIIGQLAQQFGMQQGQAEAGAGAVLQFLKNQAGGAEAQSLIEKIPGAQVWLDRAAALPAGGGAEAGGGLLGQAAGLLGSLGGQGGTGIGDILGKLQATGLNAESAAQFVPALIEKLGDVAGPDLVGRVLEQVPMLKGLVDGQGGGGLGGLVGKFLK